MASNAFLLVPGWKGTSFIKGRENQTPVIAIEHEISDGKHGPLKITKFLDQTSPLIHQAQSKCEVLPSVGLHLYHMPASGDEKNYCTITLSEVQVVAIRTVQPLVLDPAYNNIHEWEEVSFVYNGMDVKYSPPRPDTLETGWSASNTSLVPAPLAEDWWQDWAKVRSTQLLQRGMEEAKARAVKEWEELKAAGEQPK
ncbi:MAG TPA: type VI secretion system tube protein TssD [Planctomycetota bacterium]